MSHNTFGHLFRVTSWGESHGPAIGCVVDGCPPGLALSEADIQPWLDRRRPGTSRFVTQRREPDRVRILSGAYEGRTTGTPLHLQIENQDQRSRDYGDIARLYRPGHADYAYDAKYGLRDPRGGGRSSARETATRVAAGAVARLVLGEGVRIRACVAAIGGDAADEAAWDWEHVAGSVLNAPEPQAEARWQALLDATRKRGSSVGALIAAEATGLPAGWGAPVYGKLDAELAAAMMSINAVKGVEIGVGFAAAAQTGEEAADTLHPGEAGSESPRFEGNNNGGVLGGISTGQPLTCRIAIKPTSSILSELATVTRDGEAATVSTKGRHDPCVGVRAPPVAEAMMACVLADAKLRHRAQTGRGGEVPLGEAG